MLHIGMFRQMPTNLTYEQHLLPDYPEFTCQLPNSWLNGYTVLLYSIFHIAMPTLLFYDHVPVLAPPASMRPLIDFKVPAGFPSPAADYTEKGLDLNAFLISHKEASYFFQVTGHSMSGAGIMDGDIVLVDRAVEATHGHIVLAVIDGEYTLKRLHRLNDCIELHPENPDFSPLRLAEGQVLEVWGVVTAVVRKMRV